MAEEKDARKVAKALISKYRKVFGSADGRDVLRDLARANFVNSSLFQNDSSNEPHVIALREGQRNTVLRIFTILKIDPDKFIEQSQEEGNHV